MKTLTSVFASLVFLLSFSAAQASQSHLLKGSWLEQTCQVAKGDLELSAQTSFKFEGNQVIVVNRYYESLDCTGEATYSVDYQGTLKLGEINVYSDGATVTEYSIIIPSAVVESAHFESGITLSSVDGCDMSDWSFGDSRDVFSCVFSQERTNIIQKMALIEGNTLLQGQVITKQAQG